MSEKELLALEEEVEKEVADSVEFADNSPFPDAEELYKDVYVDEYPFIVE